MKKLIIWVLLFTGFTSCLPTSHIAIMPNEPAFESKGQVKLTGTLGPDHAEGNAAVSLTNHIGLLGGYYQSIGGAKIYECGLNVFTPVTKSKDLFLSFSGGFGEGKYNGGHLVYPSIWGTGLSVEVNNYYLTQFCQLSLHKHNVGLEKNKKIGFSLKCERLFFKRYYMELKYTSGSSAGTGTLFTSATDKMALVLTPCINYYKNLKDSRFFLLFQGGVRLANTFTSEMNRLRGAYAPKEALDKNLHPIIAPLMLNFSLGAKL